MKQSARFFCRMLLLLLFAGSGTGAQAQQTLTPEARADIDSAIDVSFLTCGPGNEVYSLYGHTAIRLTDRSRGMDVAVNYGIFSFSKPFFVLRFIFGLTDYEMGIIPYPVFCREYEDEGRWVCEQHLALTAEEKMTIAAAIADNYRPEHRVYRYNYFYDNCTTRARDMIVNHLTGGGVVYPSDGGDAALSAPHTYRELVHAHCAGRPWTRFGNDMLLGVGADLKTTGEERQFLPVVMMRDMDGARVDGRRLVDYTAQPVPEGRQPESQSGMPTPRTCALLLLMAVLVVTAAEIFAKKDLRWFDALLMTLCGMAGIVLFLMLFSQHPTVRVNLQLLLLNPLPLFFIRAMLKRRRHWQYALWTVLICLFFVGAVWQTYAEGMLIVASSLLVRNVKRLCTADSAALKH